MSARRPVRDEGFGLDFLLLSLGVRTVIGTLWSVPDLVTASIVNRYRRRVFEGTNPAVALLEAQRWWQSEGLDMLLEQLRRAPVGQAVAAFAAKLGMELAPETRDSAVRMLGPGSRAQDVERLRAIFSCPVSWAALRFVGVPERGPRHPWVEMPERPLSDEEQQQVEQCLAVESVPVSQLQPEDFRESLEEWLAHSATLKPGELPSVAQALQVARLLRDRLVGSHQDNLLAALAWLHEVLAAPELAEAERARLSVEAAHLWLEVALIEQWPPFLPQDASLARAKRLLESLPREMTAADILAARARLYMLLHVSASDEPQRCIQEAWEILAPALEQLQAGSYESLRVATVAVELLPGAAVDMASRRERTLERVRALAEHDLHPSWMLPAWQRLCGALDRLQPDASNAQRAQHLSTPRELMEVSLHAVGREAQGPAPSSVSMLKIISEALSQMESSLWGYPSDNRWMLVRTTGTLGAAYRSLMKAYLSSHIRNEPEGGRASARLSPVCLRLAPDLPVAPGLDVRAAAGRTGLTPAGTSCVHPSPAIPERRARGCRAAGASAFR